MGVNHRTANHVWYDMAAQIPILRAIISLAIMPRRGREDIFLVSLESSIVVKLRGFSINRVNTPTVCTEREKGLVLSFS